jgi:hypothetical protein
MNEPPGEAPVENCGGVKKFLSRFRSYATQEKSSCIQEKSLSAWNLISSCTQVGRNFGRSAMTELRFGARMLCVVWNHCALIEMTML